MAGACRWRIPVDDKLAGEMHAMEWDIQPGSGKQKVTAKTKIKRELGRSPDRYDALALACYEPPQPGRGSTTSRRPDARLTARGDFDPTTGRDAWRHSDEHDSVGRRLLLRVLQVHTATAVGRMCRVQQPW